MTARAPTLRASPASLDVAVMPCHIPLPHRRHPTLPIAQYNAIEPQWLSRSQRTKTASS